MIQVFVGRPTDPTEWRQVDDVSRTEWDTDEVFAARLQDRFDDLTIRLWDGVPISAAGTATRMAGSLSKTIAILGAGPWDPWQLLWSCISAGIHDLDGWRSLTLPGYTDQDGLMTWHEAMRDVMRRKSASCAADSFGVLASTRSVVATKREDRNTDPKTGFIIDGWDRPIEWAIRQARLSALTGMRWGLIVHCVGGEVRTVLTNFSHLPFPLHMLDEKFFEVVSEDGMYVYISEDNWWFVQPTGRVRPLIKDADGLSREASAVMPFLSSYRLRPVPLGATVDMTVYTPEMDAATIWLLLSFAIHCDPVIRTAIRTRRQQKTGVLRPDMRVRWGDELIQKWGLDTSSTEIVIQITTTTSLRTDALIRFLPSGPIPDECVPSMEKMLGAIVSRAITLDTKGFIDSVDPSLWGETVAGVSKKIQVVAIDDLTKTNPLVFIPTFYKSLCQAPLQPIVLTDQQAAEHQDSKKLLFPPEEMHGVAPTWYGCRPGRFSYPGLKRNEMEGALFPLVPCCFEKPQDASNRNKLLRMRMGLDVVTVRRKDNIIRLAHIIRYPGQLGVLPEALEPYFMWKYPDQVIYRVGMNRSQWSFMECLQYVMLGGVSMPVQEWYPAHLIRVLNQHPQWLQAYLPFHDVDSIIEAIRIDPSFWVNPEVFLPFMERLFDVHIRVWSEESDGVFRLVRSAESIVRTHGVVYIIQHRGGRMDRLMGRSHPQCELIAHHAIGEPIDILGLVFTDPFVVSAPESTPFELWTVRNRVIGQTTTTTGLLDAVVLEPRTIVWALDPIPTLSTVPYTTIDKVVVDDASVLARLLGEVIYHSIVGDGLVVVVFRAVRDGPRMAVVCREGMQGGSSPEDPPPFEIAKIVDYVRERPMMLSPMNDPGAVVRDESVIEGVSDACVYLFSHNFADFRNEVFEFIRRRTVVDAGFFKDKPFITPPCTYGNCFEMFSRITRPNDDPVIVIPSDRLRMRLCYLLMMIVRTSGGSISPIDPSLPRGAQITDDPSSVIMPWATFRTVFVDRPVMILDKPFSVAIGIPPQTDTLIIFRTDRIDAFRVLEMEPANVQEFLERFCPPMTIMDRNDTTGFVIWSIIPVDPSLDGPTIVMTEHGWRRSTQDVGPPLFLLGSNRILLHPFFLGT